MASEPSKKDTVVEFWQQIVIALLGLLITGFAFWFSTSLDEVSSENKKLTRQQRKLTIEQEDLKNKLIGHSKRFEALEKSLERNK